MTISVFVSLLLSASSLAASLTELNVEDLPVPEAPQKFQVGPAVSALSLPRLFAVGVEAKYDRLIGVGLDWGYMPGKIINRPEATITQPQLNLAVYPWRKNFFTGLSIGYLMAHSEIVKDGVPVSADANMLMLSPHIGWRWAFPSGFFIATQLGVSICVHASINSSSSDADVQRVLGSKWVKNKLDKGRDEMVGKVMPYFSAIQLGWYL